MSGGIYEYDGTEYYGDGREVSPVETWDTEKSNRLFAELLALYAKEKK